MFDPLNRGNLSILMTRRANYPHIQCSTVPLRQTIDDAHRIQELLVPLCSSRCVCILSDMCVAILVRKTCGEISKNISGLLKMVGKIKAKLPKWRFDDDLPRRTVKQRYRICHECQITKDSCKKTLISRHRGEKCSFHHPSDPCCSLHRNFFPEPK